jgi:tRNA1(Val) A37 N6-methylase TrmN6
VRQRRSGHRAGTDSVLLAVASAALLREGRVIDLGAGVGTVGLIITKKVERAHVFLVESDPVLAQMARDNIHLNSLESRANVIEANILASPSERRLLGLHPEMVDMVVTNPPFLCVSRPCDVSERSREHRICSRDLESWFRVAVDLLVPYGSLICIYRADEFSRLLPLLEKRFGGLVIRPIHAYISHPAIRFLIMGRKGSRAPLRFLPPLILHKTNGRFTDEVEALHRGELTPMMFASLS